MRHNQVVRFNDPEVQHPFEEITLPANIERETHVIRDEMGDFHILQRKDGIMNVTRLDTAEAIMLVMGIANKLLERQ